MEQRRFSAYAYRGSLKDEAVQAVKRVRGIDDVVDRIELLPSSPLDESTRLATFASVSANDVGRISRHGS
jgi:hypothetical protein